MICFYGIHFVYQRVDYYTTLLHYYSGRPRLLIRTRLGLVTWRYMYQVRIPVGTDICHRGCAYTVHQTVQRNGVYSAAYDNVHYEEPLRSFEIILASGFLLSR